MPDRSLYLASASPRRRELIGRLGLRVTVGTAPIDEDALTAAYAEPPEGLAEHLARAKALAALRALAEAPDDPELVLGADTTVLLDGRVLGKPRDPAEAGAMLRALRGRAHRVVTGLALGRRRGAGEAREDATDAAANGSAMSSTDDAARPPLRSLAVATRVHMRAYGDDEIARYVASGDPLDKAGAYGVQHPDFQPVARVAGCYLGVVGLPLCGAAALLADATGETLSLAATPDPIAGICPWSDRCRPPLPDLPVR